jgi:tetratricopeptide (TPR) repeat protein
MTWDKKYDDPAWSLVVQGENERRQRQFDDAIAKFTAALESFNDLTPCMAKSDAYICRGAAIGQMGNELLAIEDFSRAITITPQYALPYYNRAFAKQMLGQYGSAIEDYSRAIELRPDHASSYVWRGLCFKKCNDLIAARRDFAEARRLRPYVKHQQENK